MLATHYSEKWARLSAISWTGRIKKLVQDTMINIGIWNIGFLTEKLMKIVDTMIRRKINIICLQKNLSRSKI